MGRTSAGKARVLPITVWTSGWHNHFWFFNFLEEAFSVVCWWKIDNLDHFFALHFDKFFSSKTIVFCYQNCSKKAWKSVRKNDTSVNKKFFQLNQGWKRTSRKRFLRPRPFLRSRPKAETEKWRPRPKNVSEMSFFNRGLIENIFYSHESFFITLFKAFLEQFW